MTGYFLVTLYVTILTGSILDCTWNSIHYDYTNNNDPTRVRVFLQEHPCNFILLLLLKLPRTNYSRLVIHFLVNANAPRVLRECSFLKLLLVSVCVQFNRCSAMGNTAAIGIGYLRSCE